MIIQQVNTPALHPKMVAEAIHQAVAQGLFGGSRCDRTKQRMQRIHHKTAERVHCPPLDVICVPGGGIGQVEVMQDPEILSFLKQQSAIAHYVTSVCTGSMILAAAGLLQGYKATCHWAFRDQLAMLGVDVVPERVVIDRDRITGAGVTSGIDFGLTLLSVLCGEQVAQMAQLMMEYTPGPPFDAGTPETAGKTVVEALLQAGKPLVEAFWAQTQASAAQLECNH